MSSREEKKAKRLALLKKINSNEGSLENADDSFLAEIQEEAQELIKPEEPAYQLTEETYLRLRYEGNTVKDIGKLVGKKPKEYTEWRKKHGFYKKEIDWLRNEYNVRYLKGKENEEEK